MIDAKLLEILVCPESREPLRLAEPELVAQVNEAIAAGVVRNHEGEPVTEPIDGGLVRADGARVYPIRDEIPVLLIEEAIALPLPHGAGTTGE